MMVHFPAPRTKKPMPIDKFHNLVEKLFPGADVVWEAADNGVPGHYVIDTKLTIVAEDEELFVEPYEVDANDLNNIIDLHSHPKFIAAHHEDDD